jgi:hypothetical protein
VEPIGIFYILENCFDNILNQNEYTMDCSGICNPTCSHCDDGIMDYDEYGADCGGPTCAAKLCRQFQLQGNGYCLGHTDCKGTTCFETTDLLSASWTCAQQSSTYAAGTTCSGLAFARCTGTYGEDLRGLSTDAKQVASCNCGYKCYYTSDVNTFVVASFKPTTVSTAMYCYTIATCSDGVKNGDETDIDCGGDLCSPICDVDHDWVVDDVDSCVTDPENDVDGDQMCRDNLDELCPYRWPDTSTEAPRKNGQSNGLPYCQRTVVGKMCKSKPISDDAMSDYEANVATLYPLSFLPVDVQELCYQLCANVKTCKFFSLVPSTAVAVPLCYLHSTCAYSSLNTVNNSVSFSLVETCFDGILNQNEQTTDCGGVCEPTCACKGCHAHSFVAMDSECTACATRVVYDEQFYSEEDCAALCTYLGTDCEAYDSKGGGFCHIMTRCGFYGSDSANVRRRLRTGAEWKRPAGGKPALTEMDEKEEEAVSESEDEQRQQQQQQQQQQQEEDDDDRWGVPSPSVKDGGRGSKVVATGGNGDDDDGGGGDNGFPSPAPSRSLLSRRLALGATTDSALLTTIEEPAPCDCCYQSDWVGIGPKESAALSIPCRVCGRNNCATRFKCFDKTGLARDIQWECYGTSTQSPPLVHRLTTTPNNDSQPMTPQPTTPQPTAIMDCGHGITAVLGDGSECEQLWLDSVMLGALVEQMISEALLLSSLQTFIYSVVSGVTEVGLSATPFVSFFTDVDDSLYGLFNGVVEFQLALTGVTNGDLRIGSVEKDLRNAIADVCGLPINSASIIIDTIRPPVNSGTIDLTACVRARVRARARACAGACVRSWSASFFFRLCKARRPACQAGWSRAVVAFRKGDVFLGGGSLLVLCGCR